MFSFLDVIYIIVISVISLFFIFIVKTDKLYTKSKFYLKFILLVILLQAIIELAIYNNLTFALYFYPFVYLIYFSIYPLLYLYFKTILSFNNIRLSNNFIYFLLPICIFLILSYFYYPLSISEKQIFFDYHLSQTKNISKAFVFFKLFVIPAYYIQMVVYLFLNFKLIYNINRSEDFNENSLLIIKIIKIYIFGVLIYEGFLAYISMFLNLTLDSIKLLEMAISLVFILFIAYLLFSESIMSLQFKLINFNLKDKKESNINMTDTEIEEIKNLLVQFLTTSKLYLDPNLSIDVLSKKLHISARKISTVINTIYKKNYHQFINEYRINESIALIKANPDWNFDDLFIKSGFNSRSTFNRVFKEVTGKSPSEYFSNIKNLQL